MKDFALEISTKEPMKYWSPAGTSGGETNKKYENALVSDDYFLSLKRDGIFVRFVYPLEGEAFLQTRTFSKTARDFVRKEKNAPQIMEYLTSIFPRGTVTLGEICSLDKTKNSKHIVSLFNCLPAKCITRQKTSPIVFYAFELLAEGGKDLRTTGALERIKKLREYAKFENEHFLVAEYFLENKLALINQWLQEGHEGGVLKMNSGTYIDGSRPRWITIKVKQTMSDSIDLVLMELLAPTKNYRGDYIASHKYWENQVTKERVEGILYGRGPQWIAVSRDYFYDQPSSIRLGAFLNGKLIEVCKVSGLSDDLKEKLVEGDLAVGEAVFEVSAMSRDLVEKSLRHPVLVRVRPDKPAKDCIYTEIF
jgi:hypothetical protein